MKLSLFALAASSLLWLAQALPVHDVNSSNIVALDKRADHHGSDSSSSSKSHHSTSSSSESGLVSGKHFDRVVIIIFENKDYETAMENDYFKSLPSRHNGVLLTNYRGTSHPSQPNYIAMISGSTDGTDEDDESNIDRKTIVDLLEKKNISWKSYQEDYPGGCNKEMDIDGYARKHNPFISFKNIQKDKKRCARIVNSKQLDKDIENNSVPQYVFYTPDINNDAHDTDVDYGAKWLKKFLEPRIKKSAFSENTMFVVTFDEDDSNTEENHVYTAIFGPDWKGAPTSSKDKKEYDHYSLLRTIEDNVSTIMTPYMFAHAFKV
ncbi:phosphoesterase family-domain-containing protein [Zychaea mexicana]|uniref:phosphoesterase family-domain-containing protein n=1 Tax=Zychaea mexicana TaxID=64656 RepID=UPI0022FF0A12|nr:phosphoesterase family-domain-containing protein [Zychaea mexicana]KAI9494527.1 phosphoesterase family-domain-containing protein [Zychaea mexicana]